MYRSTREPNGQPRRAFTIVEIFITTLILLVVLFVAYTFMTQSMQQSTKAQLLSEAVQAGAILLHSLQTDLAATIPGPPEDTIKGVFDPSTRIWSLLFARRPFALEFDFWNDGRKPSTMATYYGEPIKNGKFYSISRLFNDKRIRFSGAHATAIRFRRVDDDTRANLSFMRINMKLIGLPPGAEQDPNFDYDKMPDVNKPKAYLLTFLCRIPSSQ